MDLKNPTRTEALLANIAGYTGVPVPDMKNATRSERLLKEILDNGGGGGGDVTKEYVDNAIADAVTDINDDISALSDTVADKVDKVNGKSLSANDYTDADKALVADSPITVTATASPISTANGKPRAITIFGKSEVVDGAIKSAGEGWSVVRLADLTWSYIEARQYFRTELSVSAISADDKINNICSKYTSDTINNIYQMISENKTIGVSRNIIFIKDTDYTTVSDFVASLGNATLCYQLADPSQGNAIAIKTDDGTGIDGTMATFTTGTPLYGVSDTARDVMVWDGSSGEVTKKCTGIELSAVDWTKNTVTIQGVEYVYWSHNFPDIRKPAQSSETPTWILSDKYEPIRSTAIAGSQSKITVQPNGTVLVSTEAPTDDTITPSGNFVYQLATPTTEQLTQTENDSISALKTYSPQTAITINDNPEFEIEAYANTANGQAISDMQPTRSPLLTLSANGWTNNAQIVTYEHNTGKRNSIDVEPANIKAWTAAGILATSETATSITFECDTTPTVDLSFRVTSMEVR